MPVTAPAALPQEHPLRDFVTREVHSRPFEALRSPQLVSHIAMVHDSQDDVTVSGDGEREHVRMLCQRFGVEGPDSEAESCSLDLGGVRLRWERHMEFSSYTLSMPDQNETLPGQNETLSDPFQRMPVTRMPADWLAALPGKLMAATHLVVLASDAIGDDSALPKAWLLWDSVAGCDALDGKALAWTDFRVREDGYNRILIKDQGMTPRQTGRLVMTLLEIETYRLMALMALPLARTLAKEMSRLDKALGILTERLTQPDSLEHERDLLTELSSLAAQLERTTAQANFRFGAARAYYSLVLTRIEQMRERRLTGLQTVGVFMQRRMAPAMNTCQSVADRQEQLARRLTRAGNLLRTRVDVALEAQNGVLLSSMDERAKHQIRLQETVEGLSVVVLSYYTVSLISYLAKGLKASGLPIATDVVVAVSIPVVALSVWGAVRYLRRRFTGG